MPRVVSTGSIVTAIHPEVLALSRWEAVRNSLQLRFRLFAVLDEGDAVLDPKAISCGTDRLALPGLEQLKHFVADAVELMQEPVGADGGCWQRLIDELAQVDVKTDVATLLSLPFDVLATGGVREALEDAAGAA